MSDDKKRLRLNRPAGEKRAVKKKKAWRRLTLSFALIFLIPLGMSVLFYFYVYEETQKSTDTVNANLLYTIKSTCDREITFYENFLIKLAMSQSVRELSAIQGSFRSEDYYQIYTLYNELCSIYSSLNYNGGYCKNVFVYFQDSDKIVSSCGSMSFDTYCNLYSGKEDEQKEALRQAMAGVHLFRFTRLESDWVSDAPVILLTMTGLQGEIGESSATVGIWVDMNALNASIESEDGLEWMMLGENGQVLNRQEEYPDLGISYKELEEEESAQTVWQDEAYFARSVPSDTGNWKYVLLMQESLIHGRVRQIRNVFVASIMLCVCIGFVAAVWMMRMNYSPLKNILDLFRTAGGAPEGGSAPEDSSAAEDEYKYLEIRARTFFREYADFRQRVEDSSRAVSQYYLAGLLERPYDESEDTPDRLAVCAGMKSGKNLVLLIRAERERKADKEVSSLKRFIVRNVFEEGIGEEFRQQTVELGETIAMILNLGEEPGEYCTGLQKKVKMLENFISSHFGFQVYALCGEEHEGLSGIHTSYQEARRAEEYIFVLNKGFIRYSETKNNTCRRYPYSQEQEERILDALREHNVKLAVSYINKVLEEGFRENQLSPDIRRCLLYDLSSTLMKATVEKGAMTRGIVDIDLAELSTGAPLEEIMRRFGDMAEAAGGQTDADGRQPDLNERLCGEVWNYIQENYSDPDLNISMLGQHFHMTPAYLSSIFKKQTGESLLKVIVQTRVHAAEKMLSMGVSVAEAGERVGFRDSSTFIRTFKKYTGVTPGQIKGDKMAKD